MDLKLYLTFLAALATIAVIGLVGVLAAPFVKPLVWALLIGVATIQYHRKLARRMPNHPNWSAGIMVLGITFCLILPLAGLVVAISQNAADWLKEGEQFVKSLASVKSPGFLRHIPFVKTVVTHIDRMGIDITGYVAKHASGASQYIVDGAANAAKNIAQVFFTLAMSLFILFFMYRDGDAIVAAGVERFYDKQDTMRHYLSEFQSTTTAVIVGTLFTCLIQGALAGLGYYVAGTPLPVLFGIVTGVAGLLPVIGTGIVWLPLAAYVAFQGEYLRALLLALWCLIVVIAITDNIIRPLAIGAQSDKIPMLAVVLGAVGGVMTIGVLGLIVGPIVFGLLTTFWRDIIKTRRIQILR